jgi:H+-transporting ATPase
MVPSKAAPASVILKLSVASEGLTSREAADRLEKYGLNAIPEAHPQIMLILLGKFWGLVPWMLELAVILDLVLARWVEAAVIGALLVVNALMGFAQEKRAKGALALLRQRLTINARVRRDDRWQVLPAEEIVPDDVVHLRVGDIVPADIRVTEGDASVDQSQLTGESLPVEHRAGSTVYAGSLVRRGEATGVVSATGTRTYFGKTAELVRTAEAPARAETLIVGIAKYLAALDILLAVAVVAAVVIRGTPLIDSLPFVLMLLVASIPHALPTMFTMSAALGASALAEKGILVTRLAAIQDAAAMDVLCLDKTGTLTQNQLAVAKIIPFAGTTSDEVLRMAALASDEATQDPIDLAFIQAANARELLANSPARLSFEPFDPSTKRSEVMVRDNDQIMRVVKGEPSTVAELSHAAWETIKADVAQLSAEGARVLAVAAGTGLDLRFAGLIALSDPPREDSAALISDLASRGVRVLLVTGDGEATARAVAAKVGIPGEVAPPGTIGDNLNSEAIARFGIFPRVFPQDKFLLVQALQNAGYVVGMTGDGVNDAPALRQADVGIAVASATDVAKAAASLVLTRPGLSEIVAAVDGSREIYQRMRTFISTMSTFKMANPAFFALGVLWFGAFVVSPLLMVLLMFATDVAVMSVSMDQVIASRTPDRWTLRPLMLTSFGVAVLLLLVSSAVFWLATNVLRLGVAETQTLVFVWLVFGGSQAMLYLTRARGFFWQKPYPGKSLRMATIFDVALVTLMATFGWLMAPISPSLIGGVLLLAIVFLIVADLLKVTLTHLMTKSLSAS